MRKNIFFILLVSPLMLEAQTINQVHQIGTSGSDCVGNIISNQYWEKVFTGNITGNLNLGAPFNYSGCYIGFLHHNIFYFMRSGDYYPSFDLNSKIHTPPIAVAKNDNIYLFGFANDTTRFGNFESYNGNDSVTFFSEFLPNGLSTSGCELSKNLRIVDIAIDDSYNLYLTGKITGPLSFSVCNFSPSYTPLRNSDIILIKIDTLSSVHWIKEPFGTGVFENAAQAIASDKNSNIYLSGHIHSNTQFDSIYFPSHDTKDYEGFLAKYDSAGSIQWVRYAGYDALDVAVDSNGNCFVGGYAKDTSWVGDSMLVTSSNHSMFLSKFDTNGNLIWILNNQFTDTSQVNSITIDSNNFVYATGSFNDTLKIGSMSLFASSCLGDSITTTFVLCVDSIGHEVWGKSLVSCNASSEGLSIAVENCEITVGGEIDYSTRAVYFDTDSLTSFGNTDGYFMSLDSCMNINSVSEQIGNHDLILFPNPAIQTINVQLKNKIIKIVNIFDVYGHKVKSIINSNELSDLKISVCELNKGMYYCQILSNSGISKNTKFIVL